VKGARWGIAAIAAAAAVMAVPPEAARSGTIKITTDPSGNHVVTFTGAPGERNDIVFGALDTTAVGATLLQPGAVIQDRAHTITGDCTRLRPRVRFCPDFLVSNALFPSEGENVYKFDLGDGDDRIQLIGGHSADIYAGDGDDVIWARQGSSDLISCGWTYDVVVYDPGLDHEQRDCMLASFPRDEGLVELTLNEQQLHLGPCEPLIDYGSPRVPCPLLGIGH
jgi:hypothetical protein